MKLIIFSIILILAPVIYAQERLGSRIQIREVKLVGYIGQKLRISFDVPCNSSFYGIASQPEWPSRLKIGAVIQQRPVMCTSLPTRQVIDLDFIPAHAFKFIAPMQRLGISRNLWVSPFEELRETNNKKSLKTVPGKSTVVMKGIYRRSCGRAVANLVQLKGQRRLKVGVIVQRSPRATRTTCPEVAVRRAIAVIDSKAGYQVSSITPKTKDLTKTYFLKLAQIKKGSVRHNGSDQGLKVTYKRRCQDAPVGIVLKEGPSRARKKGRIYVGVLVAHFPNRQCLKSKPSWDTLNYPTLTLAAGRKIGYYKPTLGAFTLAIKAPIRIITRDKRPEVAYSAGCERSLGTVYAQDYALSHSAGESGQNLAIGVLTRADQQACYKPLKTLRLKTSAIASTKRVFPLKLSH